MTFENVFPVVLIAGMALLVANVIWGFRDARRRGRSGILVAMLVLWSFPLGALLWVLFRPDIVEESELPEDPDRDLKRRANAGTL